MLHPKLTRLRAIRRRLRPTPAPVTASGETMLELHAALSRLPSQTVIAGDSIAQAMPLLDLFTGLRNRGIGGDTIEDLDARLPVVLAARPARLLLLVGANDLLRGGSPADVERRYELLLDHIAERSPQTQAVVLAMVPAREDMEWRIPAPLQIDDANRRLAAIAERRGLDFVDINTPLRDESGRLAREHTIDGIHLVMSAYMVIAPLLAPYFTAPAAPAAPGNAPGDHAP